MNAMKNKNKKKRQTMDKKFHFDLETTGVRYWKNGIHQLAGMIEIGGEIKEEFDFHIKPHPKAIVEGEALAISGKKVSDLETHEEMMDVHSKLINIMDRHINRYDPNDKFTMYGYNCSSFDCQFLRAFFTQNGDKYFGSWFWSVPVDVIVVAMDKVQCQRSEMENFQLRTVCKWCGVEFDEEKAHDALYDIRKTRELYEKIKNIKIL